MENITPITWANKVNSPELLAYLQQFGEEHYLSAEELNELRDKINSIISRSNNGDYEIAANKQTIIEGNENSDDFYGSIKSWITFLKDKFSTILLFKMADLSDNASLVFIDSTDGKTKKKLWSEIITYLKSIFQAKDDQIEISSNTTVQNSWNGKTILFTANCIITVPGSLNSSLMFPFRTLSGVTVTWAITSPFTWETTPSPTTEKSVGHFMRRGSSNTIMLDF